MNFDKTVTAAPAQQLPGPEQPGTPDQPLAAPPGQAKDDPFSHLPPLYDPDADFIADAAPSAIRKLLTPEPDAPTPATGEGAAAFAIFLSTLFIRRRAMSSHPGLSYTPAGSPDRALLGRLRRYALFPCLALAGMAFLPHPAQAQNVPPLPFNIVGHIEKFTEDSPGAILGSGKMRVNGIDVVIPKNTVLVMPASYQTMNQVFDGPHPGAPLGGAARKSGWAMADLPLPIVPFEATILGNIVGTPPVYIAGLVYISQQAANTTDGFIKHIDFTNGELCVGADPTPLPLQGVCMLPNTRVRINDPVGRYGRGNANGNTSPDERFSVDSDNPTIHAKNGYPMCVPRVAPPAIDPLCPMTNRLTVAGKFLTAFTVKPTLANPQMDPKQQVPFVVGDFITFSGTHATGGNFLNPLYVSAHTIEANVAAFTQAPDTPYFFMEKSQIGAGPTVVCTALCAETNRMRVVGFITDPSQTPNIGVYAIDVDPVTGTRTTRKLLVPSLRQAVVGRFRLEIFKSTQLLDSIDPNTRANGGATRELLYRVDNPALQPVLRPRKINPVLTSIPQAAFVDGSEVPNATNAPTQANGLVAGQYVAPTFDFIFQEFQPGGQPPPNNYECLAFLARGWGIQGQQLNIGQLSPWPGRTTPPTAVTCAFQL